MSSAGGNREKKKRYIFIRTSRPQSVFALQGAAADGIINRMWLADTSKIKSVPLLIASSIQMNWAELHNHLSVLCFFYIYVILLKIEQQEEDDNSSIGKLELLVIITVKMDFNSQRGPRSVSADRPRHRTNVSVAAVQMVISQSAYDETFGFFGVKPKHFARL